MLFKTEIPHYVLAGTVLLLIWFRPKSFSTLLIATELQPALTSEQHSVKGGGGLSDCDNKHEDEKAVS